MIDIHTHILPGVDDGAKNLDISIALLKQEKANGVDTVYLTPHNNKNTKTGPELKEQFQSFLLQTKDIGINLKLGSEIYYYHDMIKDLKEGKILTMDDTKYVLVEFSTRTETDIAEVVYEIVRSGYTPIIAHIERYPYLTKGDYFDIKENGALIQVNASSFKSFGTRRKMKYFLKNNLIDYVASDCHSVERRNVDFSHAVKYIKKKFPEAYKNIFEKSSI